MSRPPSTFSPKPSRGRRHGLTTSEALITLFLVGLAFSMIHFFFIAQAKVERHQQAKERFLVDCDALVRLLNDDLSSAFMAQGTVGSSIVDIGHLSRSNKPEPDSFPFNAEPRSAVLPEPADFRGKPLRSTYTLNSQTLRRQSQEIALPAPAPAPVLAGPYSDSVVMTGLSGISVTVAQNQVDLDLTISNDGRVTRLSRTFYAPGLAP